MKIVATSTGQDLDCALDPRFGRCAYFAALDTESGVLEAIPNPFLESASGAGTQAAQWVLNQEADVLLTGHCGPKAAAVLRDAGIRVVEGASGSLREACAPFRGASGRAAAEPAALGIGLGLGRGAGNCQRACRSRAVGDQEAGAGPGQCRGFGRGQGRGQGRGLGRRGRG